MSRSKRLIFILLSWLIVLVVFELIARFFIFRNIDLKTEHEVFYRNHWIELERSGREIINPYYRYDDYLGWDTKPGAVSEDRFNVTINSHGVRSYNDYEFERNTKKRVLLVGDSYAFGEDNNDRDIASFIMERELKNTEFINLGVGGYGHDQMLLKLKRYLPKYKPDAVILLYISDDDSRNIMNFRDYAKPEFKLSKSGGLVLTNEPVPSPEEILKAEWSHVYIMDIFRFLIDIAVINPHKDLVTRKILKKMYDYVRSQGVDFYVLPLICNHEIPAAAFYVNTSLLDYLSSLSVEIWPLEVNAPEAKEFIAHWTPGGHRILAGKIKEKLSEKGYN